METTRAGLTTYHSIVKDGARAGARKGWDLPEMAKGPCPTMWWWLVGVPKPEEEEEEEDPLWHK